jgi:hypothetical protein
MLKNIKTRCLKCSKQPKLSTHDQATGCDCPKSGYAIY